MFEPPTTHVGLLYLYLRIPLSRSLKDKRSALRPGIERARRDFNAAVAEVGHQDDRHRAVVACSTLSNDRRVVEKTLQQIRADWDRRPDLEVLDAETEIL